MAVPAAVPAFRHHPVERSPKAAARPVGEDGLVVELTILVWLPAMSRAPDKDLGAGG